MEKKYMSVAELAEYIGVSKPTAYQLAHMADFPAIVLGERRIIVIADMVDEWMRRQAKQKSASCGETYDNVTDEAKAI